ncbi:MAG TPA: hypothetical protein VM124_01210, partial [Candidatus Limnocylindrales bacterium]|nr:hypothetical protein [Candidatus Limnocylindrales bacterium]
LHGDAMLGRIEERSESYGRYVERVPEILTPQCAPSTAELLALPITGPCGVGDMDVCGCSTGKS